MVHFVETAKTEQMTAGRRLLEIAQLQLQQEEEDEAVLVTALVRLRQKDKKRRRRRWWVRPWIERRQFYGQYETLFNELDREFDHDYMGYLRMDRNTFAEVLYRVAPRIAKCEK